MSLFTPINADRTMRLMLESSDYTLLSGDLNKRGHGRKATVLIDGKKYGVFGIGCGLGGCVCDAYLKEVSV